MKTAELPKIDYRSVKPIQGNLKDLSKDNFDKLKRVLEKRGFDIPIFIWNGFIIDGHQRVRVATEIDLKPYEVPYIEIEAKDENEAKKRVLEISSQYGTITQEGYDEFTADLPEAELIETVNFDALSWAKEEEVEEDEPPEVPKEPAKSKLGEIYQLGRHRLMCGDATKDVPQLMDGAKADMVFTDPPYGMDLDTDYSKVKGSDKFNAKGTNYTKVEGDDEVFDPTSLIDYFGKVEQFFWGGDWYYQNLPAGGSWIIWDKRHESSDSIIGNQFETLWSLNKHKRKFIRHLWVGITAKNKDSQRSHPTEKPVQVLSKVISEFSDKGALVADVFGGSGSTLIACEQLDRTCYMMELDPKYCDVIRKRYWKLVNDDNEDGWEDNTPIISEKAESDGKRTEPKAVA